MGLYEAHVPRKRIVGQLTLFLLWLGVTCVGAWLRPSASGHGTHQELGLPPCPSVLLFDRPCPGCGLTTSWTAFIHGQFAASFHAHALGPLLYLLFTAAALVGGYGWLKGKRVRSDSPVWNRALIGFTVVFLAYGAGRMALSPHFGTSDERLFSSALHP
jgi:hypothetical protein